MRTLRFMDWMNTNNSTQEHWSQYPTEHSARQSDGEAETTRRGSLTASITVRVDAVDSTGNLYVRGDKVVSVNREQEHILLTGLVRPEDIASDNSVLSSRLADARIDYYGRGVVGDKQNVPLVHRLFDWLWPF